VGKSAKRRSGIGKVSVAVLAGGESRRMGTDKALIDMEGEPLVVHVAHGLQAISDDVFIVCKRPIKLEIPIPEVLDELEDQTPLSGIITALYSAKHPLVFACACDMPFISNDVVEALVAGIGDAEAIVPRGEGTLQSLHAVWSKTALPKLEAMWADGERAVHRILEGLETRVIDVDEPRSFTNVNTRGELAAILPEPTARAPSKWKLSGD
jgi:molybdopterin-guanine dinucleotide biosynthesis protein A